MTGDLCFDLPALVATRARARLPRRRGHRVVDGVTGTLMLGLAAALAAEG